MPRWVRSESSFFMMSEGDRTLFFIWIPKVTFGQFFWLVFCMPWARILLLFEAFGSGSPRPCVEVSSERFQRTNWRAYLARQECFLRCRRAIEKCFFMDSKGNVRTVFLARVLHALGANPAAVRGFRKRFFKAMCRGEFGGNPADELTRVPC